MTFQQLDKYLECLFPEPVKSVKPVCNHDIIKENEWYVCKNCGRIMNIMDEVPEFIKNIDFSNKTHIPMNNKNKNIARIHKWTSYDYYEVRNYNMVKFIDDIDMDGDVKAFSKKFFLEEYNKIRTRGKIKNGLVAYSIYKASLYADKDYDLDEILKILGLTYSHYNNAVMKLENDKLLIPKDINKYYDIVCDYMDKNDIIRNYNTIREKLTGYNSKTILIATIYLLFNEDYEIKRNEFMKTFKINIKTLTKILNEIEENKIKL